MRAPAPAICVLILLASPLAGDTCGPVEVVVSRVGDGAAPLDDKAQAAALVRYSATGSLLATYPLPTSTEDLQKALTFAGTGSIQGQVSRSADGRFAIVAGYAATPGSAVAGSPSEAFPRVVGRIDATGAVDTSTALDDFADEGLPTSATSADGSSLWAAGSTGGVRSAELGDTSSTLVVDAAMRQVAIFGGQLYVSLAEGSDPICAVGTGLPTTADTLDCLPGGPLGVISFAMLDLSPAVGGIDTLYATDASGISKWTFDDVTGWNPDGTAGSGDDVYRGVAATVELGVVQVYAIRLGSQLVRVDDASGYGGTLSGSPSLLASAPANTGFRGVALAPVGEPVGVHCDDFESGNLKGWIGAVP